MEVHQLRYFTAVVQTGGFTAAAEACHVSQPSLSIQIAKLESEAGGALLERNRTGARLTERGRLLLPRATEILRQLDAAALDWAELDGLRRGEVTLGCLPTTGAYLLPPLLKEFRRRYPDLVVRLREESSPLLVEALQEGEVDLAIVDDAGSGVGLQTLPLFSEPLLVAVPRDHALADRGAIAIEALAGEPLIVMKAGHGFRTIVLDYLTRRGIEPHVVYESSGIETVQALVEAGLGISIVPRLVRKDPGPVYLDILPPTPTRTLSLALRASGPSSPAAAALEAVLREGFSSGSFGGRPG
jgi:LysR family hydrogen peroxide-inducible transcriptional activator